MDMSLGCLGGHEIVSCMVQWTLDGKDPEVLTGCMLLRGKSRVRSL